MITSDRLIAIASFFVARSTASRVKATLIVWDLVDRPEVGDRWAD